MKKTELAKARRRHVDRKRREKKKTPRSPWPLSTETQQRAIEALLKQARTLADDVHGACVRAQSDGMTPSEVAGALMGITASKVHMSGATLDDAMALLRVVWVGASASR